MNRGSATVDAVKPLILLAEDDEDVRRMIVHMVGDLAEVAAGVDGLDAFEKLRKLPRLPDLIITDIMMPRVDGLQLLERIRAVPAGKQIPVIILTAKSDATDVIAGINAGARHYLTKPFQREELLDKIKSTLKL